MKILYYRYILTYCLLITSGYCYAQTNLADSTSEQLASAAAITNFNKKIGDQSRLYNGAEYIFYDAVIKGNPYYNDTATFEPGSVIYDGINYSGVSLLFDLNKDCVITLLPNKFTMIKLITERVRSFDISGHHFIYLDKEKSGKLAPGFYNQVYNGGVELLVKNKKLLQKTSGLSGTIEYFFSESKEIYLKKGGVYTSANSKGAMLNILKDKSKELKQYIGTNNINFDDNKEQAMVKVAAYYDQLTK